MIDRNLQHGPLIRPAEAAAILGVSTKTLKGFVSRGEIRYIDVGNGLKKKRRMFTESDLLEFIERRGQ